jgi:hypothetical protein
MAKSRDAGCIGEGRGFVCLGGAKDDMRSRRYRTLCTGCGRRHVREEMYVVIIR